MASRQLNIQSGVRKREPKEIQLGVRSTRVIRLAEITQKNRYTQRCGPKTEFRGPPTLRGQGEEKGPAKTPEEKQVFLKTKSR